jgi:hypothetical protein
MDPWASLPGIEGMLTDRVLAENPVAVFGKGIRYNKDVRNTRCI